MTNTVIIVASGIGKRFCSTIPKQFVLYENKTILEHTIEKFENHALIDNIIVVINENHKEIFYDIIKRNNYKKISNIAFGGKERFDSVYNGLSAIENEPENVLIHDGVRPFVSERIISDCINALQQYQAVSVGIKSVDTIMQVKDNIIIKLDKRETYRRVQTPQCFKYKLIKEAYEKAKNENKFDFTDDAGIVFYYNLAPIFVVEGDENNIKITQKEDLL